MLFDQRGEGLRRLTPLRLHSWLHLVDWELVRAVPTKARAPRCQCLSRVPFTILSVAGGELGSGGTCSSC